METVSTEALPLMEYEPAGSHVYVEFHLEQMNFCFLLEYIHRPSCAPFLSCLQTIFLNRTVE